MTDYQFVDLSEDDYSNLSPEKKMLARLEGAASVMAAAGLVPFSDEELRQRVHVPAKNTNDKLYITFTLSAMDAIAANEMTLLDAVSGLRPLLNSSEVVLTPELPDDILTAQVQNLLLCVHRRAENDFTVLAAYLADEGRPAKADLAKELLGTLAHEVERLPMAS